MKKLVKSKAQQKKKKNKLSLGLLMSFDKLDMSLKNKFISYRALN